MAEYYHTISNECIGINCLGKRKHKSLYIRKGNKIHIVASFSSDENAELFEKTLERFLYVKDDKQ